MKKILIPVDLKEVPRVAFQLAGKLSKFQPVEITLLHIVEFPVVPGNYLQPMDYVGELYAATIQEHQKQLEELSRHPLLAGLQVRTHQVTGALRGPGEEIADYADRMSADLVLAFSKHRKGMAQLFAGSELLRVVRFCKRPLLVLSADAVPQLNRIAFATDFSEVSAKVYGELKQIGNWLEARVMLFHVNTLADFASQRQFTQRRNSFLGMVGLAEAGEMECYNDWGLESGIINYTEDSAADIIAMATHGRKGLGHLFYGSLTENLVQNTTFPILVLNAGDAG